MLLSDKKELLRVHDPDIKFGTVSIPDSINKIAHQAFSGHPNLTRVTIPKSVTKIEACAFFNCGNLRRVTLPGSLTYLGKDVFLSTKLESVLIDAENEKEYDRVVSMLDVIDKEKVISWQLTQKIITMQKKAIEEFNEKSFPIDLSVVEKNIILEYAHPNPDFFINQEPVPHEERLLPLYERRLNLLISKQIHLVNNQVKKGIKQILLDYLEKRINELDSSGDTAQYSHARLFPLQKSFDEKEKAVYALLVALDGKSYDLKDHLSTLRNGRLGKALREFIQKGGAFDIVGSNVTTVRQFVDAIVSSNSVKPKT